MGAVGYLLEGAGQRMPVENGSIAATTRRHGPTIVTGHDKDFLLPGLKVFNPFKTLRSSQAGVSQRQDS